MIAKRASGHGSARLGELRFARLINGIDAAGQVPGTRLSKAKQHPIAVRDRPLVTAAPAPPAGLRAPFSNVSAKGKALVHAAGRVVESDPTSRGKAGDMLKLLKERGYPHLDLLPPLLAHRLWPLNPACAGDWKPGCSRFNADAEAALEAISHPLLADFEEAFRAVYAVANDKPGGHKIHKILRDAWQGDFIPLRGMLKLSLPSPSERMLERYAAMIQKRGIVDTVVSVLEQLFELERTVEYVKDTLVQFKSLPATEAAKAKTFGEFEPVVLYLPRYLNKDTIQRQLAVQAQEAVVSVNVV